MRLTANFTLEEFTRSSLAARAGIDNTPPEEFIPRLQALARTLETIRETVGPLRVSSGYRSAELNALLPGSAPNSAHTLGWAADIESASFAPLELAQMILHLPVKFDQLILEYKTWVHLSIDPRLRRMVLTKSKGAAYTAGLVP